MFADIMLVEEHYTYAVQIQRACHLFLGLYCLPDQLALFRSVDATDYQDTMVRHVWQQPAAIA